MPKSYPLVTAGLTCYNAVDTVERAVESARSQDWPNLEIVIVDDCSTDGSFEFLVELAAKVENMRLIRHSYNMGVGAARNTLVKEAEGEFLAFFDDDDESLSGRVTQQYKRILDYEMLMGPVKVACYSARQQLLPCGTARYEAAIGMDKSPAPHGQAIVDLILLGRPLQGRTGTCATCSLMARRSLFDQLGGFNPRLRRGEDTDFNIRLAFQGGHFAGLSAPLVRQTITRTADKDIQEERKNALFRINSYRVYLESINWYGFSVEWINLKFDLLRRSWGDVLRRIVTLSLTHPLKMATRLWWLILLNWRRNLKGA